MEMFASVRSAEKIMGRLSIGCDLLESLTDICREKNIRLGRVEAIGAVTHAQLGYYDQAGRTYQFKQFDSPLEIAQLTGNISLKDGRPFIHAHVTLADKDGNCYGGHLAEGTVVFACEYIIEMFDGPALTREADADTGLTLWAHTKKQP